MMPHVTCVCLTADRQAFTDRAVKCFLAQTYPEKSLLLLDNGEEPYTLLTSPFGVTGVNVIRTPRAKRSVGSLRNAANYMTCKSDIIAHWDSDDYSHPLRLAWQVHALTGDEETARMDLDAVGYRSMLFWDSRRDIAGAPSAIARATETAALSGDENRHNAAWMYEDHRTTYAIGTSLMYWRKTWEKKPFAERNRPGVPPEKDFGEDHEWIKGLKVSAEPGFFQGEPAMVAEIHGGNLTNHDDVTGRSPQWRRAPEWDVRLKEMMKL